MKEHVGKLFLLGLMILCFSQSIVYSNKCSADSDIYMLYQKNNLLGGKVAIQIQNIEKDQEAPLEFTIWGTRENSDIINEELNRVIQGNALYIAGSIDQLFKTNEYLDIEDYEGCILSEDLAYELFGGRNIVDQSLLLGERELVVRGILKEAEETIVLQADMKTEEILDAVAVKIPSGSPVSSVISTFQNRYGIGENKVPLYLLARLSRGAVMLFPAIMGFFLFFPWFRAVFGKREIPFRFVIYLTGSLCFLLFYIWITGFHTQFPMDFTPTRWSDFDFWSRAAEEKKTELFTLFQIEKREPERIVVESFLQTVKYSVLGLGIYLLFIKRIKIKTLGELYLYCIGSLCFTYLSILFHGGNAYILAGKKELWSLTVIYMTGIFLLENRNMFSWESYRSLK